MIRGEPFVQVSLWRLLVIAHGTNLITDLGDIAVFLYRIARPGTWPHIGNLADAIFRRSAVELGANGVAGCIGQVFHALPGQARVGGESAIRTSAEGIQVAVLETVFTLGHLGQGGIFIGLYCSDRFFKHCFGLGRIAEFRSGVQGGGTQKTGHEQAGDDDFFQFDSLLNRTRMHRMVMSQLTCCNIDANVIFALRLGMVATWPVR